MREITIYKALAEKKLLTKKVEKLVADKNSAYQLAIVISSAMTDERKQENKRILESNFNSSMQLISNLEEISQAIAVANSKTIINIDGKDYPLSYAIAKKISVGSEKKYYQTQLDRLIKLIAQMENQMEETLSAEAIAAHRLAEMQAHNKDKSKEALDEIEAAYIKANTLNFYDPMSVKETLEKRIAHCEEFITSIECVITETNCNTKITVSF